MHSAPGYRMNFTVFGVYKLIRYGKYRLNRFLNYASLNIDLSSQRVKRIVRTYFVFTLENMAVKNSTDGMQMKPIRSRIPSKRALLFDYCTHSQGRNLSGGGEVSVRHEYLLIVKKKKYRLYFESASNILMTLTTIFQLFKFKTIFPKISPKNCLRIRQLRNVYM